MIRRTSKIGLVIRALRDERTPTWAKGLVALAFAYTLMPIDAVPDLLPVLGWLDDVAFVALSLSALLRAGRTSP